MLDEDEARVVARVLGGCRWRAGREVRREDIEDDIEWENVCKGRFDGLAGGYGSERDGLGICDLK